MPVGPGKVFGDMDPTCCPPDNGPGSGPDANPTGSLSFAEMVE